LFLSFWLIGSFSIHFPLSLLLLLRDHNLFLSLLISNSGQNESQDEPRKELVTRQDGLQVASQRLGSRQEEEGRGQEEGGGEEEGGGGEAER